MSEDIIDKGSDIPMRELETPDDSSDREFKRVIEEVKSELLNPPKRTEPTWHKYFRG